MSRHDEEIAQDLGGWSGDEDIDPADLWDEDGYQSYKDGVAMGYINEDGSQREPREPDFEAEAYADHCDEAHGGGACDCPPPSPGDWSKVAYVGLRPEVVPEPGHQPEWLPDIPALLAAVEAVLAHHQPGRAMIVGLLCGEHECCRHFSVSITEAAGIRGCPDCTATVYVSCAGCGVPVDQCPDRLAITRHLLGKEGTEGEH